MCNPRPKKLCIWVYGTKERPTMNDNEILKLYIDRNEQAISETSKKYGNYCMKIAINILSDRLDSEECVNDTYMKAWGAIPPQYPNVLSAFLGKITRNLAINKMNSRNASKRVSSEYSVSLSELDECIPDGFDVENEYDAETTGKIISEFLRNQPDTSRRIFVCRYFYCESVEDIAKANGFSESKVKSVLFRLRNKLRTFLESEGITV